ncbi:MAG: hypothetical protein U1E76_28335 [Planctomycetota bacterium]
MTTHPADHPCAGVLSSGAALLHKDLERRDRGCFPTTIDELDHLLCGGIARGSLVEMAGAASSGRFALVLAVMASVATTDQAAALIDLGDHLDPQLAHGMGVDLSRLLWLRPRRLKDALASAEIVMETGMPLVVLDLGLERVRAASQGFWVRLQRTAAARGAALLISTSHPVCGFAADVALSIERVRAHWLPAGAGLLERMATRVLLRKRRGLTGVKATSLWLMMADAWSAREADPSTRAVVNRSRLRVTA